MSTQVEMKRGVPRPIVVKKKTAYENHSEADNDIKVGFWTQFEGQRLVFQMKGNRIIKGTFAGKVYGMLRLENATITGIANTAQLPWVFLDLTAFAHFHPEGEVEKHRPVKADK